MSTSTTSAWKNRSRRVGMKSIFIMIAALAGSSLAPMEAFAVNGEVTVNCSISGSFKVLTQGTEVKVHSGNTCKGLAEIPADVTKVGGFANDQNLTSIQFLGNNVRTIEVNAFYNTGLTSIVFPASVETIEAEAMIHSSQLTSVTFEPGSRLQTIGQSAFADIQGLTEVTLPASLTAIGNYAFRYNRNLRFLNFESGSQLRSIADYAFDETRITSVSLSSTVQTFTFRAFPQGIPVNIASDNPHLILQNGVLFNRDMTTVLGYPTTFTASSYVIPSSVTRIESGAFEGAQFTSVTIPDSVTYIGSSAFNVSRLTSVRIPASVTTLEFYAFNDNPNLASVVFAPGSNLTTIKYAAFQNLPSLTTLDFGVGSRLTTIIDAAFRGSGLTSVTLPASLEYLEAEAFRNSSRLSTVSFEANSRIRKIGTSAFSSTALNATTPTLPNLPLQPMRTGYSFAGWSLTEVGAAVENAPTLVAQGRSVFSLWNVAPTVTRGEVENSQVVSIPAGLTAAEVPATESLPKVSLAFAPTSASASATMVPIENPADVASTPFAVTSATKIVDIQVSGITGPVTVCLEGESTDEVYHFTGGAWVTLPDRTFANGEVCGVTESFSPFAAAQTLPPAPAVTVVAPYTGPLIGGRLSKTVNTAGDSLFTINGHRMEQVTSVVLEGKPLTIVSKSDSQIVVKTPAHAAGFVDLLLKSDSTALVYQDAFEYRAPAAAKVRVTTSKNIVVSSSSAKALNSGQQKSVRSFVDSANVGAVLNCQATYLSRADMAAAQAVAADACAVAKKSNPYITTRVLAPVSAKAKSARKVQLSLTR